MNSYEVKPTHECQNVLESFKIYFYEQNEIISIPKMSESITWVSFENSNENNLIKIIIFHENHERIITFLVNDNVKNDIQSFSSPRNCDKMENGNLMRREGQFLKFQMFENSNLFENCGASMTSLMFHPYRILIFDLEIIMSSPTLKVP